MWLGISGTGVKFHLPTAVQSTPRLLRSKYHHFVCSYLTPPIRQWLFFGLGPSHPPARYFRRDDTDKAAYPMSSTGVAPARLLASSHFPDPLNVSVDDFNGTHTHGSAANTHEDSSLAYDPYLCRVWTLRTYDNLQISGVMGKTPIQAAFRVSHC